MTAATPDSIAAHLTNTAAPAVAYAHDYLHRTLVVAGYSPTITPGRLARRIMACAEGIATVDLPAIALSLAGERVIAEGGRPRNADNGGGSSPSTSSTTASIAEELYRIRAIGLDLREALDRIMPDPDWPTIESGSRGRLTTATELLEGVIAVSLEAVRAAWCLEARAPANLERTYDELADAVEGMEAAIQMARQCARRAERARAWRANPADVDMPPVLEEFARCSGWPRKRLELEPCENYTGAFGHVHPDTGAVHHRDLCDECYLLICPVCWARARRTPKAKECAACEIAARRNRKKVAA